MKEIIYVYTTPTYKLKSWFKIGMTNQGSGSIRISQQDGTSNPERLEKQYEMDISGETELSAYEVEQKIHRFYERLGKRVRDNREWFEVEGGVEEIKRVIESILDNSELNMKYIVRYENFNESKGISDSCERITYSIWNDIENDIINTNNISSNFTFSEEDFKIKDIQIDFIFTKDKENSCGAITDLKNSTIEDSYLLNTKILFNVKYHIIDDAFLYYIKSVIFHEILHVFQNYNLKINDKFRPESFSIGSIIPQIRSHIKTKYVSYILDILYYSLSHELSAQLHQYYIYKIDDREYKRLDDIKNLLTNFKIKELDSDESKELDYVKIHILNSIKYFTNNKNYKKDIESSIWNKNNEDFLNGLSNLIKRKLKWVDKKIKLINNRDRVDYNETFTYYGDLQDYKYLKFSLFIKENLNNCPIIDNI